MKKNVFLVLLLSFVIVLSSCKKEDENEGGDGGNNGGNNNPPAGTLTLKVDGAAWNASLAVVATKSTSKANTLITVTGSDSDAHQAQIAVHNVTGPGTYDVGGNLTNPSFGRWTEGLDPADTYTSMVGQGVGTVTFTEITDTGVKGTFQYNCKNMTQTVRTISEGSFEATFSDN